MMPHAIYLTEAHARRTCVSMSACQHFSMLGADVAYKAARVRRWLGRQRPLGVKA